MQHTKYKILLALFLISLLSSILLAISNKTENLLCKPNGEESCGSIYNSEYSYTFGIRNCYYGIAIFFILSVVTLLQIKNPTKQKRNLIHLAVIIGTPIAIYFLYLQKFVIQTYCKYCLAVDTSIIIAFVLVIWKWRE